MNFVSLLIILSIGFLVGNQTKYITKNREKKLHESIPNDIRTDDLFVKPTNGFKTEARKIGFKVKDARNKAYPNRFQVFYTNTRKQEYFNLLKKHGLAERSHGYIRHKSKKH